MAHSNVLGIVARQENKPRKPQPSLRARAASLVSERPITSAATALGVTIAGAGLASLLSGSRSVHTETPVADAAAKEPPEIATAKKAAELAAAKKADGAATVVSEHTSETGVPATGAEGSLGIRYDLQTMRDMDTRALLSAVSSAESDAKSALAEFCVCRVHDLRDLLLDEEHKTAAKEVLVFHAMKLRAIEESSRSECQKAQLSFLENAVSHTKVPVTKKGHVYGHDWGPGTQVIQSHKKLAAIVADVENNGYHGNHGPIATWDVREVKNMAHAFSSATRAGNEHLAFEYFEDLSFWDTRSAKDMSHMFEGLIGDVKVGIWDTGNVESMGSMFRGASSFNGDISGWDVRDVSHMAHMFHGASKFNQDLTKWSPAHFISDHGAFDSMIVGSAMSDSQMPRLATTFGERQGRRSFV